MGDSTQETAYRHIKALVIGGHVKPNEQLVASKLAGELSISRTPVREALTRLEQDGLVDRAGGWGYTVHEMRLADIEELFKVREALEIMAVSEAIANIDRALIDDLEGCLKQAAACKKDPAAFIAFNRDFYSLIAAATHNELLRSMLSVINDRVQMIGAMTVRLHAERTAAVLAENRTLLNALERKNRAGAVRAVRDHIRRGRNHAVRIVERSVLRDAPTGGLRRKPPAKPERS